MLSEEVVVTSTPVFRAGQEGLRTNVDSCLAADDLRRQGVELCNVERRQILDVQL